MNIDQTLNAFDNLKGVNQKQVENDDLTLMFSTDTSTDTRSQQKYLPTNLLNSNNCSDSQNVQSANISDISYIKSQQLDNGVDTSLNIDGYDTVSSKALHTHEQGSDNIDEINLTGIYKWLLPN